MLQSARLHTGGFATLSEIGRAINVVLYTGHEPRGVLTGSVSARQTMSNTETL